MPKHEKGSPKEIANRVKSKGLQKLRWYCQMCQKQCRDQNGFKCHLTSESHQRQLLLFGENPESFMSEFNSEFKKGYLDILRRQYGTKRVRANQVYTDYIRDKNHVHMNATTWHTLTGFVEYMGKAGICRIDHTEKGWYIQYIDQEEEERKMKSEKKRKMDYDDDEAINDFVQKAAERERQKAIERGELDENGLMEDTATELSREEGKTVGFSLKKDPTIDAVKQEPGGESGAGGNNVKILEDIKPQIGSSSVALAFGKAKKMKIEEDEEDDVKPGSSRDHRKQNKRDLGPKKSNLELLREQEERRKEIKNRKDFWLHKGIVVKITTKRLGDAYHKKKGVVTELIDDYTGMVRLVNGHGKAAKLDQAHLETVIPAIGKPVFIVNGAYRGNIGVLESLREDDYAVSVRIDEGPLKGRLVEKVAYEDVSKMDTSVIS